MLDKLIEAAKLASKARLERDSRINLLIDDFHKFSEIVKDIWLEHRIPSQKVNIDEVTFTLSDNGCSYQGSMTRPMFNKLMQFVFETVANLEQQYNSEYID